MTTRVHPCLDTNFLSVLTSQHSLFEAKTFNLVHLTFSYRHEAVVNVSAALPASVIILFQIVNVCPPEFGGPISKRPLVRASYFSPMARYRGELAMFSVNTMVIGLS